MDRDHRREACGQDGEAGPAANHSPPPPGSRLLARPDECDTPAGRIERGHGTVSADTAVYTVRVHDEPDGSWWAEVDELPGCFASGHEPGELREHLEDAISTYLSESGHLVHVELEDEPGSVTERRVLARTA